MEIIKVIRKEKRKYKQGSPSRYVSEHLDTAEGNPHTTAPILDYVQVTHTKSNIFKKKGCVTPIFDYLVI